MAGSQYLQNPTHLQEIWQTQHSEGIKGLLIGEFDLLNAWHALTLKRAIDRCDTLTVGLWSDASISERHGGMRPILSLEERAAMLLGTHYVDYVLPWSANSASSLERLKPDIVWMSSNLFSDSLEWKEIVEAQGGAFFLLDEAWGEVASTEALLNRVVQQKWSEYHSISMVPNGPIWSEEQVPELLRESRGSGKIVVTTNGSFDVLHLGHLRYLQQARELGDLLLVLVNDDASISHAKGQNRPLFKQSERMRALAMLECVDFVVPFRGDNPLYLLEIIKPDWHIKGGSFEDSRIAKEKQLVESHGGQFKALQLIEDFSSTNVLERISQRFEGAA